MSYWLLELLKNMEIENVKFIDVKGFWYLNYRFIVGG